MRIAPPKLSGAGLEAAGIEFTNNGDQPGVRVTKAAAARPAEPCSAQSRRVAAKVVGRKTAKAEREETISVARSVSSDKSRLHPTNVKSAVWRVTRKPNRSTPTEPSFRSEAAIPRRLLDEARAAASGPLSASDDGHDSSARSCRRSSMASRV
jgi:hypothetical protein